jgi:hypothetical protein
MALGLAYRAVVRGGNHLPPRVGEPAFLPRSIGARPNSDNAPHFDAARVGIVDRSSSPRRLLVEQVVIAWLDAQRCSLLYDAFADGMSEREEREVAAHVARLRNAAARNYRSALKALGLIQKAAPAVTVNVTRTVNVTGASGKLGR